MNIVEFIMREDLNHIKDNLIELLQSDRTFCDEIIGEGGIGSVSRRKVGSFARLTFKNYVIQIPIVFKKNHTEAEGFFKLSLINDTLYLSSYRDITAEAIICAFMAALWYRELSPHIQLTVGFNKCQKSPKIIDQIVSEYQGLNEEIPLYSADKYLDRRPFFHPVPIKPLETTRLSTLEELCQFIVLNQSGLEILLPNKIKCNVVDLINSLLLSYIHTAQLLYQEAGLILNDMHAGNIFIHWITESTRLGSQDLSDLEVMEYETENRTYRIKTYGLLLKMGDIGSCLMNPRDDLWILGQCPHIEQTLSHLEFYETNPFVSLVSTIGSIASCLSMEILDKTLVAQILRSDPFDKFNKFVPFDQELVSRLPSASELIKTYFGSYVVGEKIEDMDAS